MAEPKPVTAWMTDMDGVLVHEGRLIPGADAFVSRLRDTAARLELGYARAATPGTDPRFVTMIRELVQERTGGEERERLGTLPVWDVCPADCCPAPQRRGSK